MSFYCRYVLTAPPWGSAGDPTFQQAKYPGSNPGSALLVCFLCCTSTAGSARASVTNIRQIEELRECRTQFAITDRKTKVTTGQRWDDVWRPQMALGKASMSKRNRCSSWYIAPSSWGAVRPRVRESRVVNPGELQVHVAGGFRVGNRKYQS